MVHKKKKHKKAFQRHHMILSLISLYCFDLEQVFFYNLLSFVKCDYKWKSTVCGIALFVSFIMSCFGIPGLCFLHSCGQTLRCAKLSTHICANDWARSRESKNECMNVKTSLVVWKFEGQTEGNVSAFEIFFWNFYGVVMFYACAFPHWVAVWRVQH